MRDYISERAVSIGEYIIQTGTTVRAAAGHFHVSKSTVHKDVTERLVKINPKLATQVHAVLDTNRAERHIRGGMATKRKYSHDGNE